ncbi:hypothetical protein L6452_36423 [Arctium lappa]|uniref:Uncharacterized protein n=1 Tax=Arctium lappa TaxID=4217 RepID=A0ACB8Y9T2_ARCLA|nr:hypothetical protein L6452_36423 [Arctium lappa]
MQLYLRSIIGVTLGKSKVTWYTISQVAQLSFLPQSNFLCDLGKSSIKSHVDVIVEMSKTDQSWSEYFSNPIQIPNGPITRVSARRIRVALNNTVGELMCKVHITYNSKMEPDMISGDFDVA